MEVEGLFDLNKNPKILNQLKNNIVMVGYNYSISLDNPPLFHNFHDYNGSNIKSMTLENASKIRYAFANTPYYGAYMTDIIKNHVQANSKKVIPKDIDNDFMIFRHELKLLKSNRPIIISFGGDVYKLLKKHLKTNEYSKLIKVTHYSYFGDGCRKHAGYREKVLSQLSKG